MYITLDTIYEYIKLTSESLNIYNKVSNLLHFNVNVH